MPTKIVTILAALLISLTGKAQLEYQLDAEVIPNFYLDTAWCKANNIDLIKIRVFESTHKKGKGKYENGYLISVINGLPQYHVYIDMEGVNDSIRVYKQPKYISNVDTTYKTMYGYNKTTNTIVNLYQSDSNYRYYKKYYKNNQLTKFIEVSGSKGKYGIANNGQVTYYDYYPNGYLKSTSYSFINSRDKIPLEEYDYRNGVIVQSEYNWSLGLGNYWRFTAEFTYYSKGKKIPVQ